jgi:hypothetical protein
MMFPKKSKAKSESLPVLISRLDRIFSEYIRLRDADGNGNCRCITCPTVANWRSMDAGHFVQRDRKAVRYCEQNVNAQCHCCNRFRSGNQYEHGLAIDRKFGNGTAERLQLISKVSHHKLTIGWLIYQIEHYREDVNKLKKIKNIS